jgi:DNA-binding NarL/FixJ family response regulator
VWLFQFEARWFYSPQTGKPRTKRKKAYNGTASAPDYEEHRLSDCFKSAELVVRTYNICDEHNEELLSRSRSLRAYSVFVAKTREFIPKSATTGEKVAGVVKAVDYCIQNSYCPEYFSRRKAEVIDMMVDEITTEQYIELQIRSLKREAQKHAEEARMHAEEARRQAEEAKKQMEENRKLEDARKKDKETAVGKMVGKGYAPDEIADLLDISVEQVLKLSAKESSL